MGTVCAKNAAGDTTTEVVSKPTTKNPVEKQFVSAGVDFSKVEGKTVEEAATEAANAWLEKNAEWEYTGEWKTEKTGDSDVSFFQVIKKASPVKQKPDMPESVISHKDKEAPVRQPVGNNQPNVPMDEVVNKIQ